MYIYRGLSDYLKFSSVSWTGVFLLSISPYEVAKCRVVQRQHNPSSVSKFIRLPSFQTTLSVLQSLCQTYVLAREIVFRIVLLTFSETNSQASKLSTNDEFITLQKLVDKTFSSWPKFIGD